jgi:hypothetical protein
MDITKEHRANIGLGCEDQEEAICKEKMDKTIRIHTATIAR